MIRSFSEGIFIVDGKIAYGNTFLWRGHLPAAQVRLKPTTSTLPSMPSIQDKTRLIEKEIERNPDKHNGQLWRFETHQYDNSSLDLVVSELSYAQFITYKNNGYDALPIGVQSLQITDDLLIPIGIRAKGTDYPSQLGLIGNGYIERDKDGLNPAHTIEREAEEEAQYNSLFNQAIIDESAIALMIAPDGSVPLVVKVTLGIHSNQISLKGKEHKDLIFLPTDRIPNLLESKSYMNIAATPQLLASLEVFYRG